MYEVTKHFCFGPFLCKKGDKISNFRPQPWSYPFGKMPIFYFLNPYFSSLKWTVLHPENHKTVCFDIFRSNTKKDKISNFLKKKKTWTTFEKMQNFRLF